MSARVVIAATAAGRTVTLRPVRGGTVADVVALVARAAVPGFRRTRAGVVVGASRLGDVEALAREIGYVVVMTKSSGSEQPSVAPATAPPSPAVAGPHGCAGAVCRVPGCAEAS